jgi:hypothetical protein
LLNAKGMLLREAVSPAPDAVAARRVAVVFGALTAIVMAGSAYAALRTEGAPTEHVPTILIDPAVVIDASSDDIANVQDELARYRDAFYSHWVVANPGRSCPARLLEINRFDWRLHAVDPWGTPYQFLCGAQYRPTFQMRSAGADRVFDTQDDIHWSK